LPILSAISIEIFLITSEYYGKSFVSSGLIETIETPFECSARIRRAESEAEKLVAII
jgi:hypothetical protein